MLCAATTGNMNKSSLKLFPVTPNAKAPPLIVGWQIAASNAHDQLKTWEINFPGANWAAHCEDLIVLDIDPDKGGFESLEHLEATHEFLPETLTSETPSGGRHLFFYHRGGVPNSVGKLGPGVDIRSTNGYVLVQPSTVGEAAYRWISDEAEIADAPAWLADLAGERAANKVEPVEPPEVVDDDAAVKRARDWLEGQEPAIEGQGGDAHTFAVCCRLRDFGVPLNRMLEALEEWNARCEPPWDTGELYRKCVNAHKYGQNPPAVQSIEAWFEDYGDAAPESKPAADTEKHIDLYAPTEIELPEILATRYLVKGWLDRGVTAQLFGPWGAGKTFCALHMGVHIAAGKEWFGNRVRAGGVLYCGYEGHLALRKRLYALRLEYPDWDWSIPFRVLPMTRPIGKAGSEGRSIIAQAMRAFPGGVPALIIIDPLRNALGGSDADPEFTAPYIEYAAEVARKAAATVLTVHHPGHSDGSRGRGDSAMDAAMDTVINVDGQKIAAKKQRDDAKGSLYYRLRPVVLGVDADGDNVSTCVVEQVLDNPLDPTLTTPQEELYEAIKAKADDAERVTRTQVNDAGKGIDAATRRELVDALVRKGYLVEDGNKYLIGAGAAEIFS